MAQINVELGQFVVGGPYSYRIYKDGVGQKSVVGQATLGGAWDAIKADLATALGTETVRQATINVQAN